MEEYFSKYLRLDEIIAKQRIKLNLSNKGMYLSSWHTRVIFDDLGLTTYAPKILETLEVEEKQIKAMQRCLKRNQKRLTYFTAYLNTIDSGERTKLLDGVVNDEVLAEIHEIETALAYQEGYEPPLELLTDRTRDLFEDIDLMASIF